MSYVVKNLYVLSNKAVGPAKKSKINKRRAYVRRLEYLGMSVDEHPPTAPT